MRRVLVLICILSAGFASAALAQVEPPTESLCWIKSATGDPAGTQLTLEVWVDDNLDPEVYGFDIYRSVTGSCDEAVRITDEPLLRGLIGVHEYYLTDDGAVASGTEYLYRVEVVDQNRNLLQGWLEFDYFEERAYAWFGSHPLVGIGTIVDGLYGWALDPCASSCFSNIFIEPGYIVDPFANTGVEVMIFGTTFCNWEGCFLTVTGAVPTACGPVPTQAESWSSLKAKFD